MTLVLVLRGCQYERQLSYSMHWAEIARYKAICRNRAIEYSFQAPKRCLPPYSDRKAASGSARAARLAGKKLDIALTKSMIKQAGANSQPACGGEFMRLPSNFWKRKLKATPIATPRSTTFPSESRAMRRISPRCAPSATRTPNSLVRCATA